MQQQHGGLPHAFHVFQPWLGPAVPHLEAGAPRLLRSAHPECMASLEPLSIPGLQVHVPHNPVLPRPCTGHGQEQADDGHPLHRDLPRQPGRSRALQGAWRLLSSFLLPPYTSLCGLAPASMWN